MNNKKGIIHLLPLLLVGILIIAVGAGMYWYEKNSGNPIVYKASPSPEAASDTVMANPTPETMIEDEHEGWKTYTSNVNGFSLKYPKNWNLQEQMDAYNHTTRLLETYTS